MYIYIYIYTYIYIYSHRRYFKDNDVQFLCCVTRDPLSAHVYASALTATTHYHSYRAGDDEQSATLLTNSR